MKETIFIGWCGSNELATLVGKKLEEKDYHIIVGGENKDWELMTNVVHQTIVLQLQKSNQTIFLIEKNLKKGSIPNNIMIELGYALCKYSNHQWKVHIYYIGMEPHESGVSDLQGVWVKPIKRRYRKLDHVALDIVSKFLEAQRSDIPVNKMSIINSWYDIEREMAVHFTNPQYSDYELAQYLVFYPQVAYTYNIIESAKKMLCDFQKNSHDSSIELKKSIQMGSISLEFFSMRKVQPKSLYLEEDVFHQIKEKYLCIFRELTECMDENNSELYQWILTIGKQHLTYAFMLYCNDTNAKICEMEKSKLECEYQTMCQEVINNCDELIKLNEKTNKDVATLLKAYVFRDMALYFKKKGDSVNFKDNFQKSYNERQKLKDHYGNQDVNPRLRDTFDLEYYLSLAEITHTLEKDSLAAVANISRIKKYIAKQETMNTVMNKEDEYYLQYIRELIEHF